MLMIIASACAKSSSHAVSVSSPHGTSMQTSSTARASIPASRSSSSRRSRSGIRAASTTTVSLDMARLSPPERRSKLGIVRRVAVATEREYGLFINGELTESASGELRDLVEPATGDPLARAAMANEQDVDRAVDAARAALDGDWGRTAPTERSRLLHALADALAANRKELVELEARNVGKAISSVKAELFQAIENFRFYASQSRRSPAARIRSAARSSTTRSRSRSAP